MLKEQRSLKYGAIFFVKESWGKRLIKFLQRVFSRRRTLDVITTATKETNHEVDLDR